MKPVIVLYNIDESRIASIRPALSLMGIRIRHVGAECLGMSVEHTAYPDEFEGGGDGAVCSNAGAELMLLCGISGGALDTVLNLMRRKECGIPLKAMLTETNRSWSMARLINEISAERDLIAAGIRRGKSGGKRGLS